jgi:hypothetical protein
MNLTLTAGEARLLLHHLTQQLEHMDNEVVHTDKRDLQRGLAHDLAELQALTDRIRSCAGNLEEKAGPGHG